MRVSRFLVLQYSFCQQQDFYREDIIFGFNIHMTVVLLDDDTDRFNANAIAIVLY